MKLTLEIIDSIVYSQVSEELEKIKMEMDDRGSSMTDGGQLLCCNGF